MCCASLKKSLTRCVTNISAHPSQVNRHEPFDVSSTLFREKAHNTSVPTVIVKPNEQTSPRTSNGTTKASGAYSLASFRNNGVLETGQEQRVSGCVSECMFVSCLLTTEVLGPSRMQCVCVCLYSEGCIQSQGTASIRSQFESPICLGSCLCDRTRVCMCLRERARGRERINQ